MDRINKKLFATLHKPHTSETCSEAMFKSQLMRVIFDTPALLNGFREWLIKQTGNVNVGMRLYNYGLKKFGKRWKY